MRFGVKLQLGPRLEHDRSKEHPLRRSLIPAVIGTSNPLADYNVATSSSTNIPIVTGNTSTLDCSKPLPGNSYDT